MLLVARTLLGAPGRTTRNKKLLGAKGIATRSTDATLTANLSHAGRNVGSRVGHHRPSQVRMKKQAALGRPRGAPSAIPHPRRAPFK